jgi:hypothetical protein
VQGSNAIPKKLPDFSLNLEGMIWKIRYDASRSLIALETRQKEQLQASFQVINAISGDVLLRDLKTEERWWVGLEECCNGILLLHGYGKKQENGEHLGLQAIEVISGKTIWQNPELTFIGLLSETELLSLNASGAVQKVVLATGKSPALSESFPEAQKAIQDFTARRSNAVQLPVPYLPTDPHYKLLQDFIFQKTSKAAENTIEYLETERSIVLSFYSEKDSVLANFLVVCSAAGEVQAEVCLQEKSAGIGMDTFFIFADELFFIQEKSALGAISL